MHCDGIVFKHWNRDGPEPLTAEAQTMTVTVAKADVVLVPPEAMTGEE